MHARALNEIVRAVSFTFTALVAHYIGEQFESWRALPGGTNEIYLCATYAPAMRPAYFRRVCEFRDRHRFYNDFGMNFADLG